MKRLAVHATIAVPIDVCYRAVQESLVDPRWREAYAALRPGREYSGWVSDARPPEHLTIGIAALDPVTGKRMHAMGYRTTYDFATTADGRTRVEIGVEYELLAAVGGMGMLQPQAENEVLHRLSTMLALVLGWERSPAALPTLPAPAREPGAPRALDSGAASQYDRSRVGTPDARPTLTPDDTP